MEIINVALEQDSDVGVWRAAAVDETVANIGEPGEPVTGWFFPHDGQGGAQTVALHVAERQGTQTYDLIEYSLDIGLNLGDPGATIQAVLVPDGADPCLMFFGAGYNQNTGFLKVPVVPTAA